MKKEMKAEKDLASENKLLMLNIFYCVLAFFNWALRNNENKW